MPTINDSPYADQAAQIAYACITMTDEPYEKDDKLIAAINVIHPQDKTIITTDITNLKGQTLSFAPGEYLRISADGNAFSDNDLIAATNADAFSIPRKSAFEARRYADDIYLAGIPGDIATLTIGDLIRALTLTEIAYAEALTKQETRLNTPTQSQVAIKTHIVPNTKLAQKITDPELFSIADVLLDVSSSEERKVGREILTKVSLSYDDIDAQLSRPITPFDQAILDGLSTLWVNGAREITLTNIWHASTGATGSPSAKQLHETEASVDKMMRIYCSIDYSQEARNRELTYEGEQVKEFMKEGHLLDAQKLKLRTVNGTKVTGYTLTQSPILYEYSSTVRQVITYPQSLLTAQNAGSNTDRNVVVKNYLMRRVGQIKGKGKCSPNILFTSLYERADLPAKRSDETDAERKSREKLEKKVRDYSLSFLDSLVDSGYILGFDIEKEGKLMRAIKIKVEKKKKE